MSAEEISGKSANPFDIGQLLSAPQSKSAEVLSPEQYSSDMDDDQPIMADPIECQFTHVKEFVIRGTNYKNHKELKTFLNKYVIYRNKQN